MASVNKVIIVGHLGRDPELKYNQGGTSWCTISVATTRKWKDKQSGEQREETEWHRLVLNDKQAELAGQYLKKGSAAYFEGRLKTRKWQDKEGRDTYTTEILVDTMQFISTGGERSEGGGQPAQRQQSRAPAPAPKAAGGFDDGDVPF